MRFNFCVGVAPGDEALRKREAMGTPAAQDTPAEPPPKDGSATAGSRLTRINEAIRNHPVITLVGLILGGVVFLGNVANAIPGIGSMLSWASNILPEDEPQQSLAYATPDRIVLDASPEEPSTLARLQDETVLGLHWSEDGRRLAALIARQTAGDEWPDLVERRIWYRDMETREEGSWSCPSCNGLSFSGDRLLSLSDGEKITLNVFSLDALPQRLDLHGADWGPDQQRETIADVLGGGREGLLLAMADPEGISAQGGPQLIYRVDVQGTAEFLGRSDSFVAIQLAATRPNGREVAVRYTSHSSACENIDSVAVINLANSARRELPQPDSPDSWRTSSIAWSPDGDLYSTRYALSKQIEDCGDVVVKPHVARWDGDSWERLADTEDSISVFIGNDGALATIRVTGPDDEEAELLVRPGTDEEWRSVAEDVLTAAWRPPTSSSA